MKWKSNTHFIVCEYFEVARRKNLSTSKFSMNCDFTDTTQKSTRVVLLSVTKNEKMIIRFAVLDLLNMLLYCIYSNL